MNEVLGGCKVWVEPRPRAGWENMAIDQALLDDAEATGAAWLRLYRWEPFCLSFGRHEPAGRRYDRDRIEALGIDCVRRPTGGRAVWHTRELTYAVAAPVERFGSLHGAFQQIHARFADALAALGAEPHLARDDRPPVGLTAGPCFAHAVGGEVLVGGRKVLGSAQLRQGGAFLQHGSLLLEDDQSVVADLLRQPAALAAAQPPSRLLGRTVSFEEAAAAVLRAFGAPESTAPLVREPEAVLASAAGHAARFRSEAWTWSR